MATVVRRSWTTRRSLVRSCVAAAWLTVLALPSSHATEAATRPAAASKAPPGAARPNLANLAPVAPNASTTRTPARSASGATQGSSTSNARNGGRPGYWQSSRDGWFWYEDPPPPAEQEPPEEAPPEPPEPVAPASAPWELTAQERDLASHKDFQVRLENSLNAAVANPSETNLALFLELLAEARRRASVFTDNAQALAARMPWVGETAQGTRPANPAGMRVWDQVQAEAKDELMTTLASTHGLYFFIRGDCPYCHAMSPMLRQFQQKYGFTVFPITLDGKGLPLYPNAVRDNGMADRVMQALRIPAQHFSVPFMALANPSTREILPVGFGPMTASEMVDRIALVVRMQDTPAPAQPGPGASLQSPLSLSAMPR